MEGRFWRFTGEVQGVGFRWRTRELADRHGLTGWVCNRPDGSVALEAEGPPGRLAAFERELLETFSGHIAETERRTFPASGRYSDFEVVRGR